MEKTKRQIRTGERLRGNQINWNQVYYFSEIGAAGSIKDAAEKLGLSPSTLSQHLAQLEDDLEVRLFHRQHRRLLLTEEGSRLFLQAKTMFEAGQRLIDVVSPVPLGCYPVSVALVPSPSIHTANAVLGQYLAERPLTNMKMLRADYNELERGLAEARFDFGFSDRLPERKDLVTHCISQSQIRFYVAERWEGEPLSKLLKRLPLLICNAEPAHRSLAEQALIDAEMAPSAVVSSEYPSALVDLCRQGVGVGFLSEASVRSLGNQGLSALRTPREAPRLQDSLFALWTREASNTAAVLHLRQVLAESPSGTA
ncbi:MAG TPA: LysR family transcriptional regulator [Bdellovibrionota bacterium]|nr:LysR family transcriptional regulator [Bdellovibrionota bacterium]